MTQTQQTHVVRRPGGDEHHVIGRLVGETTSEREYHTHPENEQPPPGVRCSACRFFTIKIFICDGSPRYVAYTTGHTRIPGETERYRLFMTDSPLELIEMLTTRQQGRAFIPRDTLRALAQAADVDDDLYDAYADRKVA